MLPETAIKRLDTLGTLAQQGKRINGLFRLLECPFLWMEAYSRLYSNKGAATRGVDKVTMDGFSEDRALNLIKLIKENRYQPKPVRRTYIPKAEGKTRPLGIPTGNDKLVQEVVRAILERIYEPVFSSSSHGFRPARSCHTALETVKYGWTGVKWIIDMDIQGFFDNVDHQVMMQLLEKRIDDHRFLHLIRAMLKAGYMEDWKYHATYSGTPQGGIISPLLSNIYLHELDEYMEQVQMDFRRGKDRRKNTAYTKLAWRVESLRKAYREMKESNADKIAFHIIRKEIKFLKQKMGKLKSKDPMDEGYKRLWYCRYADDFLVGIIGSKLEAQEIMEKVKNFVQKNLRLTIADDKSGIRHATRNTRFLGFDLRVHSAPSHLRIIKRNGVYFTQRTISEQMQLHIPMLKLQTFAKKHGYGNLVRLKAMQRYGLYELSEAEIVLAFNAELRGFANYYSIATSVKIEMHKLFRLAVSSFFKTMARKRGMTVTQVANSLKWDGGFAVKRNLKGKERLYRLFQLKDLKPQKALNYNLDFIWEPKRYTYCKTELMERLSADKCEYCGKEGGYFEVHHVRKLKDIQDGKLPWQRLMIWRRRKTLILCVACHIDLHAGTLPSWMRK
ncbi:MAG: group II intron reverse transcriptase/maturase [Desulfobaccales bacterium]